MSSNNSKKFLWITLAILGFLLFAALGGMLGSSFILLGLFLGVLGVYVLIKGKAPKFGIQRRRTGTASLIAGAYLAALGIATMLTLDDVQPTSMVIGEECEVVGTVSQRSIEPLYCTLSGDDELAWATAEDYKASQPELDILREEALDAAEERATEAETRIAELEEELQKANL